MKNILLALAVVAVTSSSLFAQHTRFNGLVPAPKTVFAAKTTQFDNYVTAGNVLAANKTMDTLIEMMYNQIQYSSYYLNDDSVFHSAPATAGGRTKLVNKQKSRAKVSSYLNNVTANKSNIDAELANFMTMMD